MTLFVKFNHVARIKFSCATQQLLHLPFIWHSNWHYTYDSFDVLTLLMLPQNRDNNGCEFALFRIVGVSILSSITKNHRF